jgi:hypothetical protein
MKLRMIIFGLASLAILNAGSANATTYNLWGGTSTSSLNTGWTYTSSFDANLLFTPKVDVISNAVLTLNFLGSDQTIYGGTSTQVTNSGIDGVGQHWQTTNTTSYNNDSLDSVNVLIGKAGGQVANGSDVAGAYSSNVLTSSSPVTATSVAIYYGSYTYSYSCGFLGWSTCYGTGYYPYNVYTPYTAGYNNVFVNTAGYKGSFSVVANLNSNSLALLENTGLLRYGFTVTGGGVALNSATLSFNATAPVPEPETYAMLLAGLGLLGFTVLRRKRSCLVV